MSQQDIDGAGSAVVGWRRDEGQNGVPLAQPLVHRLLEHRAARAGAQALAVHHAHALQAFGEAFGQEFAQLLARLLGCKAVQVDFRLDDESAAAQSREGLCRDAGPPKAQFLAGFEGKLGWVQTQRILEDLSLVAAPEGGARGRRCTAQGDPPRGDRPYASNRFAEQRGVLRVDILRRFCGHHAMARVV